MANKSTDSKKSVTCHSHWRMLFHIVIILFKCCNQMKVREKLWKRLPGGKVHANVGGKNVILDSQPQILEELCRVVQILLS